MGSLVVNSIISSEWRSSAGFTFPSQQQDCFLGIVIGLIRKVAFIGIWHVHVRRNSTKEKLNKLPAEERTIIIIISFYIWILIHGAVGVSQFPGKLAVIQFSLLSLFHNRTIWINWRRTKAGPANKYSARRYSSLLMQILSGSRTSRGAKKRF